MDRWMDGWTDRQTDRQVRFKHLAIKNEASASNVDNTSRESGADSNNAGDMLIRAGCRGDVPGALPQYTGTGNSLNARHYRLKNSLQFIYENE